MAAFGKLFHTLLGQERSLVCAVVRQHAPVTERTLKLSTSVQNACFFCSISQRQLNLKPKAAVKQWRHVNFMNRQSVSAYSTKPERKLVQYLTMATYASVALGCVLLTTIGFRAYGRFKKRARGVEEIDEPLFGRRSRVLCSYRSYTLPSNIVDAVLSDIPWFEVRPDDIWVVSFPKSGTTWLQEIVYLISTDFDFEKARATQIDERFPYLEYPFPGHKVVAEKPSPRFIKTHLPFSLLPKQLDQKKPKVIYIARNPKDTAVSLMAFTKLLNNWTFSGTMNDFAQLFVDGKVIYGPWMKHVEEGWGRRDDENMLFITYEDLQKDFHGTTLKIARFLEKPISESQLEQLVRHCSFHNMQTNDSVNYSWMKTSGLWKKGQFLRKGEIGDWKNHLSPEMSTKFDTMAASLEPLGLHFVDS